MSSAFADVIAVIEALGGREKAARTLGVRETSISNWIVWNRLPAKRYAVIRDLVAPSVVPDELWAWAQAPSLAASDRSAAICNADAGGAS